MSNQSNILSFDEMRHVSAAAVGSAARTGRYVPSRDDVHDSLGYASSRSTSRDQVRGVSRGGRSQSLGAARSSARRTRDEYPPIEVYWSDSACAARERAAMRSSRRGEPSFFGDEPDLDDLSSRTSDDFATAKPSLFARLRRAAAKRKADRAFRDKQDEPSTGPRAALYKGEMGVKQRQASRMMAEEAVASSKRRQKRSSVLTRVVACAVAVACIAFSCAFLYPAAQQYYQTLRENDQLEAEYEALAERNATLEAEVEALQTDSGVEQYAREEWGWVMDGETSGTVVGLSDSDDESASTEEESVVTANIASGSIEMPETWYSSFLDKFFGVE